MVGNTRKPGSRRITVAAVVVFMIIAFTAAGGCVTSSGGGVESGNNGESVEKEQDPDFCYDCFPYPVKKPDASRESEG